MKYVSSLSDIPQAPHFVIVKMTSVHIPGDERSRTNPGHGYPEHTEHYTQMQVTTSKDEWTREIARLIESDPQQKTFIAYHVDAIASVKTTVQVTL